MSTRMLIKDAAKALCVAEYYLRTELKKKNIPHIKAGNRYILCIEQVEEFLLKQAIANVETNEQSKLNLMKKIM